MITSDIPHVACYLIKKHGLAARGWKFRWDHARRRAGCCRYRDKTITLSKHYVALNVVERLDDVIDTILHEIAHALAGPGTNHGPKWKEVCCRIGAKPERCYDSSVVDMPAGRLVATCGGCGREFRRHKQLRRGRWSYCTTCGPDRGRLTYRDPATTVSALSVQDSPPPPRELR